MKRFAWIGSMMFVVCTILVPVTGVSAERAAPHGSDPANYPANYAHLTRLFADWREFVLPETHEFQPDYSASAMAAKQARLPEYEARLHAIDTSAWPKDARIDYKLVQAEMNGLDFELRVLKPWARDPTFYATIFADWSDVPSHEGGYAYPNINLYEFEYPLNTEDEQRLAAMLEAVPANLKAARINLEDSNAKGLWKFGDRAFREQSRVLTSLADGTLVMRTLKGFGVPATFEGAGPRLLSAIRKAKRASDEFADWVAAQAPTKTGPTGVGKKNYNWYAANVQLIPYDWDEQALLLQRELDRAVSSLRLEELRNRDVPPIEEINDPAAYDRMAKAKAAYIFDFLQKNGFVRDKAYFRAAMMGQAGSYTPPDQRSFFTRITSLDPLPLLSHRIHWIDLARMKYEPNASQIRRVASLFNIFDTRSEGFATAFEEILMHAGLYDDIPHGRELVWIALANRAARGLASLHVQSNDWDLERAARFHSRWTPRHWARSASSLVGFEQLLYARRPGYGTSYIVGKLQLDHVFAKASFDAEQSGRPFVIEDLMQKIWNEGIIPVQLVDAAVNGDELPE